VLRRLALAIALGLSCQSLPSLPVSQQDLPSLPLQLEIPQGYRGYVVLQYALPSCAALPRRDGYEVIRFGDDGRACTSERDVKTTLRDRAYYVDATGAPTDELIGFDVTFEQRQEGTHRIIGTVFAVAPDAIVIRAIDQCRWEDAKCWEGLRSR
jgi:hypothetical protein